MSGALALQRHPVFRTGLVHDQDVATGRVRVQFPDRDNVISYWLEVITPWSQNNKAFWLPDIGEQVVVLMDEHDEDGAVVGSIYSTVDTPPDGMTADKAHVTFKDGTVVEYDRAQHTLTVVGGSGTTILLQDGIGAYVKLTNDGNVHINGNLEVAGTISSTNGTWGDGNAVLEGYVHATEDVVASTAGANISVTNHTHPQGPDSHGDTEQETGAPAPGS